MRSTSIGRSGFGACPVRLWPRWHVPLPGGLTSPARLVTVEQIQRRHPVSLRPFHHPMAKMGVARCFRGATWFCVFLPSWNHNETANCGRSAPLKLRPLRPALCLVPATVRVGARDLHASVVSAEWTERGGAENNHPNRAADDVCHQKTAGTYRELPLQGDGDRGPRDLACQPDGTGLTGRIRSKGHHDFPAKSAGDFLEKDAAENCIRARKKTGFRSFRCMAPL